MGAGRDDDGDDERLAEGTRAGEYVIEAPLGAGAMGDVYTARHAVLGKRVALKVLKRRLADSAEALERFEREARTIARLDHPNLVDVFAFGRLGDGRLWLAMRLVEGESLGRRLRERGPIPAAEAVAILRPVCQAVAAAHAAGVIHRDLKSDHIVIGSRVTVLDFGIARAIAGTGPAGASAERLTAEGAWVGTPAIMAPEQWSGAAIDARTDVYALGVVLYEMLSGHLPFRGASVSELMEQHFGAPPPPLSTPTGGVRVPAAVEAVVGRALAKRPEDRPAGALELLAELEAALGSESAAAVAPSRTVQGAPPPAHPARARMLLAAGAVGAAVVALAVVLLTGHRRAELAPPPPAPPVATAAAILVTSSPERAEVRLGPQLLGRTPLTWRPPADAPRQLALTLHHPGYVDARRELTLAPDATVDVHLEPIDGYEGVWRIPSAELRRFEFAGDFVEGYALTRVDDAHPRFLRRFEYVDAPGAQVGFGASEPHVEPAAPDEPSCRFPLATEYRFDAARDTLEQRRQRVAYELRGGRCVAPPGGDLAPSWTVWEPCERLARGARPTVAESSAGAGTLKPASKAPPKTKKAPPPPDRKNAVSAPLDDLQRPAAPPPKPSPLQGKASPKN